MSKPLCIYHGNCADGFGGAWVFNKFFKGDCDFHPGVYQSPPPDVTNKVVYLVDFSYKRNVVEEMVEKAKAITLIDHHKTSLEDLLPLTSSGAIRSFCSLEKSGAALAWEYLYGNREQMPPLIAHIEDRDLWKFALAKTREIQASVFSYPYDFAVWDNLMTGSVYDLVKEGEALERKHFKDVEELIKVTMRYMTIGGYNVPVANIPYTMTSDAGNIMSKGHAFAACYWDTPDGRSFSLRSQKDGVDVSEIAKIYGGGGHANAAGFRVGFDHPLASTTAPIFKG